MGWTENPLHEFEAGGRHFGEPDPESSVEQMNEKRVRLAEVLQKPNDQMVYEYDFGDGWTHDITLEKVLGPAFTGSRASVKIPTV